MIETLIIITYLLLILFTILFQVGLVLGKPWGEWTMGGYHAGILPKKLRLGAFVSALLLLFLGLVVIDQTSFLGVSLNLPNFLKWIVVGFNFLAVIANSATKSKKERNLWLPITIIMLACSLWLFLI